MPKPLNRLFLMMLILTAFASQAWAVRVTGLLGLGSSTSSKDASYAEGPLIQSYAVESDWDTRNAIGVEHTRSLSMSPLSTAISFTGIVYRYYFTSTPGPFNDIGGIPKNAVEFRDWAFYVGGAMGLAQSSTPPTAEGAQTAAAGVYISPKAGVDYPMASIWGVRSELVMNFQVFGSGSLSSIGLGGGIYFLF